MALTTSLLEITTTSPKLQKHNLEIKLITNL